MKTRPFLSHVLCAATLATLASQAPVDAATTYTYSYDWERPDDQYLVNSNYGWCNDGTCFSQTNEPLGFRDKFARHESVETTYNEETQVLTWSSTFSTIGNHVIDGGWLVLSDGPNPKQQDLEYAIFYLDTDLNRLTAYAYNGQNNSSSYANNPFLGSWENVLDVSDYMVFENGQDVAKRTIGFEIDATDLNNAVSTNTDLDANTWKGVAYGDEVGIWKHFGTNTSVTYSGTEITNFSSNDQYFDTGRLATSRIANLDQEAIDVPEPMVPVGLMGAAVTLGLLRRRSG